MRTAFIIAGFDLDSTAIGPHYISLRKAISAKGYKVVPVDISWRRTTISQFIDKFIPFYNKNKGNENIIIGNSLGAVVAFLSATQTKPDCLYVCSLSPFFKEDITKSWPQEKIVKRLGKLRVSDISTHSADQVAEEIDKVGIQVKVLYGEKEIKLNIHIVNRAKAVAQLINNSQLIEAKDAPHSMHDLNYVKAISKVL